MHSRLSEPCLIYLFPVGSILKSTVEVPTCKQSAHQGSISETVYFRFCVKWFLLFKIKVKHIYSRSAKHESYPEIFLEHNNNSKETKVRSVWGRCWATFNFVEIVFTEYMMWCINKADVNRLKWHLHFCQRDYKILNLFWKRQTGCCIAIVSTLRSVITVESRRHGKPKNFATKPWKRG